MPISRTRTVADIRHEVEVTERRLATLVDGWQATGHTRLLSADEAPSREMFDRVEQVLRQQRGAVERLHQLWIEYAQASGYHAPQ